MARHNVYYGIVAALPELPRKGLEGFRISNLAETYRDLLEEDDRELLRLAYMPIDHGNLLRRLAGSKQFEAGGNYDEDDIRRIAIGEFTPFPYFADFIQQLEARTGQTDMHELERLMASVYLPFLMTHPHALLRDWSRLQLQLRETVFRSQPEEMLPLLQQDSEVLRQVQQQEEAPAAELPEGLAKILRNPDAYQREYDIDTWMWDYLEDATQFSPFAIDALLNYALRQQICARWSAFLSSKPENLLDRLVSGVLTEVL